jgi:hypothetical protein
MDVFPPHVFINLPIISGTRLRLLLLFQPPMLAKNLRLKLPQLLAALTTAPPLEHLKVAMA